MWKTIDFIDGRYKINENGEIYNSVTQKYLHPSIFQNGYRVATFTDPETKQRKKFSLHRLVATAFLPNPNNYPVVLHLDNNPLNCSISNLKWGTYSENNAQAIRDGLNKVPRPDNRKVYKLDKNNSPVSINCEGIKEVINTIGFGTDSGIRNYLFRNQNIPRGQFKDWSISVIGKKKNIHRSSLDEGGLCP